MRLPNHISGYTNLWRLALVWSGRYPQEIKKLHNQYGPVVRSGPNLLDLDYAELIRTIYSTDGKWRKVQQSSPFIHQPLSTYKAWHWQTEFCENNSAMVKFMRQMWLVTKIWLRE